MDSLSPALQRVQRLTGHLSINHNQACQGASRTSSHMVAARSGPLSGIRVLDMASVISGPWATSFLADQGAEVIKLEPPDGPDMTRGLGPRGGKGLGAMYVTANRGKRSMTLDVQKSEGVSVVKRLVKTYDVVVQNYRPGVAKKLGIDYDTLVAENPKLIMLSITGYGPDGPYADAPVYDQVVQAMTGVPMLTYNKEGKPAMFYNLLVDKVSALNAAQAVTAAIVARERGHGGQHVQLSMLDATLHFLFPDAYWNKVWLDQPTIPLEWTDIAGKTEYDVADGRMAISATSNKQMWGLLEVAGLSALKSNDLNEMRAKATPQIKAILAKRTKQEVFESCLKHGVPCGKFQTFDQALADPQVLHNKVVLELTHPDGGRYRAVRPPALFAKTPAAIHSPAPKMGADTMDILTEVGLTAAEIAKLRAQKVL